MKVDREVARANRRHTEVSVYKPADSECYYYRVCIHGRRYNRSTGKTTRAAAVAQAKLIAAELRDGGAKRETMRRPGYATAGEIVDAWTERQTAKSAQAVARAFERLVRSVSSDWRAVTAERVTAAVFEKFLRAYVGSAKGRHSTWATVRSIYQDEALRWYAAADLRLPDVREFRAVRSGGVAKGEGFVAIPRATLARMDRHAERLRCSRSETLKRIWVVYCLMRWCGLRNQEVVDLRWAWVMDAEPDPLLRFARTTLPDGSVYVPKGKNGVVPIKRERLEQIVAAVKREGEFVLPRENKTEAEELAQRAINRFVRRFLPDRQKGAYELRKQYGSTVAAMAGIAAASKVLRHGSINTTMLWYHDSLDQPAAL